MKPNDLPPESVREIQPVPMVMTATTAVNLSLLATKIRKKVLLSVMRGRRSLRDARDAGKLLLEAKPLVPRGSWMEWVKQNCGGASHRQVNYYMDLARKYPDNARLEIISNCSQAKALQIAAEYEGPRPKPGEVTSAADLAAFQREVVLRLGLSNSVAPHERKFKELAGTIPLLNRFSSFAEDWSPRDLCTRLQAHQLDAITILITPSVASWLTDVAAAAREELAARQARTPAP
jgi:hypothetical protein